ncbi:MAG: tetratricopeptide repeat protein [Gemmatimonadaceae bacterium]
MSACLCVLALLLPRMAVAQSGRDVSESLRRGDSAYAASARGEALRAYRAVVAGDSSASSRAVYRLAVMLAEDGMFAESVRLHLLYARLEPNDTRGTLGLARTYAWAGRYEDAVATYGRVPAGGADQREAALGIARTQAWRGRLADAASLYDSLYRSSRDLEALKGLALVAAWQGDLVRSERLWRSVAGAAPNDPEAWTGLAQVLRWRARAFDALDALDSALAHSPGYRDAVNQRRWLDADLAPMLALHAWSTGDSDGNRAQRYSLEGGPRAWRNAAVRLSASQVDAQLGTAAAHARRLAAVLHARLPWEGWGTRAELGAAKVEPGTRAIAALGVSGRLRDRAHLGVHVSHAMLDETAPLIANGVSLSAAQGDIAGALGDRLTVTGSLAAAQLRRSGPPNVRVASSLQAQWSLRHTRSVGLAARLMQHSRAARDGYYSPRRYAHVEGQLRARRGREHIRGWVLTGEAGLGTQFTGGGRYATQRLHGAVAYVFAPGMEWALAGALSNVATAGTATAAGYRFGMLSLGGRVVLP